MKSFYLCFFVALFLVACSKDQEPAPPDTTVNIDGYDSTDEEEYIRYTIDSNRYEILDSLDAYAWYFTGASDATNSSLILGRGDFILGPGSNSHQAVNLYFRNIEKPGVYRAGIFRIHELNLTNHPCWVTLTHFPKNTREYYEGSFSIERVPELTSWFDYKIKGTFRVRRRR